ncbi:hypothetical protein [Segatella baroniae]|uniref:hypothetical protein n=1 Tax=Segatella baroniae TaxID=305719 RepID=UPI0004706D61|nr:hypothetical protein [Segatella baroniae]
MHKSLLLLFISLSSLNFAVAKPQDSVAQSLRGDAKQKKPLTHAVYDDWQTVDKPKLSTHGATPPGK